MDKIIIAPGIYSMKDKKLRCNLGYFALDYFIYQCKSKFYTGYKYYDICVLDNDFIKGSKVVLLKLKGTIRNMGYCLIDYQRQFNLKIDLNSLIIVTYRNEGRFTSIRFDKGGHDDRCEFKSILKELHTDSINRATMSIDDRLYDREAYGLFKDEVLTYRNVIYDREMCEISYSKVESNIPHLVDGLSEFLKGRSIEDISNEFDT